MAVTGQIPRVKSSLSKPTAVPMMTAKKATMLTPTIPTTMAARSFSTLEAGGGAGVVTR